MKKNENKKGAGILLLAGLICAIFTLGTTEVAAQEKEGDVFIEVETMPKFKDGGLDTFRAWVAVNLKYPEVAKKEEIEGKVYAEFIIEKDGSVSNVKVIKSDDSRLNKEVLRVIKSSPAWTPGKQNGKLVRVKFVIPVNFALS